MSWSRLVAWLNAPEDPISLALVRIVACTTIALHVARFLFSGAIELALLPYERGLSGDPGWLEPFGGPSVTLVYALGVVVCLAATLGALGLGTRPALIATWLSFRALSSVNAEAKGSYDALLIDIVFVLMLSGAGRALSLDARFFGKTAPAARWPRFLLVIQIGLLYFGSAIVKMSSGWVPGGDASALWYILAQPTWARFPDLPLGLYPLTQIATTCVWLFEITAPLAVFAIVLRESAPAGRALSAIKRALDRVRYVELYLAFGFAMHAGIEATMEVGPFCFAALALYPAAIAPERFRRAWDRRSTSTAPTPDRPLRA